MKIGDYVRFRCGEIAKITDIKRYKTKEDIYFFDKILDFYEDRACNDCTIYENEWKYYNDVKSSPNIIDLIEVGDLVKYNPMMNGYIKKQTFCKMIKDIRDLLYFKYQVEHRKANFVSIVTKEQFERNEYRVN